jgi:5'-methylthioadenosine phosphorylase
VVDQFVDRTNSARDMSFSTRGLVMHVGMAHPVCRQLSADLFSAGKRLGLSIHGKGTYINMEGPAFSTLAESKLYRSWGMDVIAMTNFAEAKLSREAEICYATLAAVTDYDCWHPSHDSVTVEMVISNLQKNIENAKRILMEVISDMKPQRHCECKDALKYSIVTDSKVIPARIKKDLGIIIGKYVK